MIFKSLFSLLNFHFNILCNNCSTTNPHKNKKYRNLNCKYKNKTNMVLNNVLILIGVVFVRFSIIISNRLAPPPPLQDPCVPSPPHDTVALAAVHSQPWPSPLHRSGISHCSPTWQRTSRNNTRRTRRSPRWRQSHPPQR